jgi:hypothetical protein
MRSVCVEKVYYDGKGCTCRGLVNIVISSIFIVVWMNVVKNSFRFLCVHGNFVQKEIESCYTKRCARRYSVNVTIFSDFNFVFYPCVKEIFFPLQGYIRCLYSGKLRVIMSERCTWRGFMNIVIFLWVLNLCTQAEWTLIKHLNSYLVSTPDHAKSE